MLPMRGDDAREGGGSDVEYVSAHLHPPGRQAASAGCVRQIYRQETNMHD
jgi:hypothetical protein